ncbi:ATP-dependent RNA helicase [Babesia caballi]|uniref:ATP-dependent RNA helicase n=1 Tax=Babesia caballi TaxID=5871 RepID=A0AAV4M126_BABCB|nr:ATP-dependent RNA helicase [Babesia caballi]
MRELRGGGVGGAVQGRQPKPGRRRGGPQLHTAEAVSEWVAAWGWIERAEYKKLLTLASAIEAQEHRLSKESKTESWLHTAAKQADIALSDEEEESEAKSRRSKTYRSLKAGKRALLNVGS